MLLRGRRNLSEILLLHVLDVNFHRLGLISSLGRRTLRHLAIVYVAVISAPSTARPDVWARACKVGPKILVIETAIGAPLATRHLGLFVLVVAALLELLMVIGFAGHDLVVIRGRRTVITLRPSVVAHIVAPIAIPVMPSSRCVGRLLPAVVFEDKLVLDWGLEPVVFNSFARRLL